MTTRLKELPPGTRFGLVQVVMNLAPATKPTRKGGGAWTNHVTRVICLRCLESGEGAQPRDIRTSNLFKWNYDQWRPEPDISPCPYCGYDYKQTYRENDWRLMVPSIVTNFGERKAVRTLQAHERKLGHALFKPVPRPPKPRKGKSVGYSVYIQIDTGGAEPATVEELGSMTWNVMPMYTLAFEKTKFMIAGREVTEFRELNDFCCGGVLERLKVALAHMKDPTNKAEYEKLNPANGWGSHQTATEYLEKLVKACERHTKAWICII